MTNEERRNSARKHLDAAESWLQRLISYELTRDFGENFFSYERPGIGPVIPRDIRKRAQQRRQREPGRFPRDLEAITFGDAIKIILDADHYSSRFGRALKDAYPSGSEEARTYLERMEQLRNQTSHLPGTCSERDLERSTCYSNDFIDSLKAYFLERNMDRVFNVPTFIRIVDNIGNDIRFPAPDESGTHFTDFRQGTHGDLYPGQQLKIETEVDDSFKGYRVRWILFTGERIEGNTLSLLITNKHVRDRFTIHVEVVSGEEWHKLHNGCDDRVELNYRVLPPPPKS